MSPDEKLIDGRALAELLGVQLPTISTYLSRARALDWPEGGPAPKPDFEVGGRPAWKPATVTAWMAARPGHGWRAGRAKEVPPAADTRDA